jgi:hypothetical protein
MKDGKELVCVRGIRRQDEDVRYHPSINLCLTCHRWRPKSDDKFVIWLYLKLYLRDRTRIICYADIVLLILW